MSSVYITRLSKFLPNRPVHNDEMEKYLGMIKGKPSPAKRIVLSKNKIECRYYALDENANSTHTNAEITAQAVKGLFSADFQADNIELLSCGTTSPDQLLPSHASMVHGLLNSRNIEIASFSGACCSGMQALMYAYMSILTGNRANAVCTGSERLSSWLRSGKYDKEAENIARIKENSFVAFEKEFLRWMLSDGAGAVLLQNKADTGKLNLKIDWIEISSYANQIETCMYAGGEKQEDGSIKGWHEFDPEEWLDKSMFSLKQDVKQLSRYIVEFGQYFLLEIIKKRNFDINEINYFLPHLSSEFFRDKIKEAMAKSGIVIPDNKWFTNLTKVGNVGSASPFLMLEELFNSGRLIKGDRILLMVPESARFSYSYVLLTAE